MMRKEKERMLAEGRPSVALLTGLEESEMDRILNELQEEANQLAIADLARQEEATRAALRERLNEEGSSPDPAAASGLAYVRTQHRRSTGPGARNRLNSILADEELQKLLREGRPDVTAIVQMRLPELATYYHEHVEREARVRALARLPWPGCPRRNGGWLVRPERT